MYLVTLENATYLVTLENATYLVTLDFFWLGTEQGAAERRSCSSRSNKLLYVLGGKYRPTCNLVRSRFLDEAKGRPHQLPELLLC